MERDAERLGRLTGALDAANLDAVCYRLPHNVLLLTGYWPMLGTAIALLTRNGEIALIVPEDERDLARRGWVDDARITTFRPITLDHLGNSDEAAHPLLIEAGRALGLGRASIRLRGRVRLHPGALRRPRRRHRGDPRSLQGGPPRRRFLGRDGPARAAAHDPHGAGTSAAGARLHDRGGRIRRGARGDPCRRDRGPGRGGGPGATGDRGTAGARSPAGGRAGLLHGRSALRRRRSRLCPDERAVVGIRRLRPGPSQFLRRGLLDRPDANLFPRQPEWAAARDVRGRARRAPWRCARSATGSARRRSMPPRAIT